MCHVTLSEGREKSVTFDRLEDDSSDDDSAIVSNDDDVSDDDSTIGIPELRMGDDDDSSDDDSTIGDSNPEEDVGVLRVIETSQDAGFEGRTGVCRAIEPSQEIAIDSIEANRDQFIKRDQQKGDVFRRFQHVASFPSDKTILHSASTNGIKNNPITGRDVQISIDMLGPSKHAAQGKTTRT